MLLKLRGGLNSFLVTILLSVLILAFAIWGIGPGILQGATDTVASVKGVDVPTQQFANQVQRRSQQILAQFPGAADIESLVRTLNLDQQVLSEMVQQAQLAAFTRDLGIRASDRQVAKQLLTIEAFQLAGGFSREAMQQALFGLNMTEDEFYTQIRRDVTRIQLIDAMSSVGFAPDVYARALYRFREERRQAQLMTFNEASVTQDFVPAEGDLEAYHTANIGRYRTPERRSFQYIYVNPSLYLEDVDYTEDDVLSAYEQASDQYIEPELRSIQQVSFATRALAEAFITALGDGAEFVETATAQTAFTADEIDLGDQAYSDVETDFDAATADAVFALAAGEITTPLPGLAGFNIFRVTSITEGSQTPLEAVRSDVIAALKQERAIDLMFDALPDIQDAVVDEPGLAEVSEKLGLTLASVTGVSSGGVNADGEQTIRSSDDQRILAAAFEAELGVPGELVDINPEDNTQGAFIVELVEIIDPQDPPFEDVQSRVQADWEQAQREIRLGEIAEEARSRVEAGEDFEAVAESLGGSSFAARGVTRVASDESQLTPVIRSLIFDLSLGKAGLERSTDGYAVALVEEIRPGDPEQNPEKLAALKAELAEGFLNDIFAQYQGWLSESYPAQINQAIIDQLFANNVFN